MISLVIAVMMIRADAEPPDRRVSWNRVRAGARSSIYHRGGADDYRRHRAALPELRRREPGAAGFRGDVGNLFKGPRLHRLCAVPGAGLADHLAFAGSKRPPVSGLSICAIIITAMTRLIMELMRSRL